MAAGVIWWNLIPFLLLIFMSFQVHCFSSNCSSSFRGDSPAHLCLPKERAALLQFKTTISFDPYCDRTYPKTNSWDESTSCCSWEGVTCHKLTGHVVGLDLSHSCINNILAANSSLFHLQGLQQLNLAYNYLDGSISSEFGQLLGLTHLNLSCNGLSGLIPSEISLLSRLVSLDLSNQFSFSLSFPNHSFHVLAQNLSELRYLFLDGVDLYSVGPTSLLNLTSSLKSLSLRECQLGGEFPTELFHFKYLAYLDLSFNYFLSSYLPKSNWSSSFSFLSLRSGNFTGSIPASIGNLTQITFLDISENSFLGHIPNVFRNLEKLSSLTLSSCNLSGQLPSTIFNLTQLSHLYLSYNRLEGLLPVHVSGLQSLQILDLRSNLLNGRVPSWLFSLPSLQYLKLSHNNLTGPFGQIQKPNSVHYISLSHNCINGSIPSSFFDLENLTKLDLSMNSLSGVIMSHMLFKLKNLETLDLSNNNLLSLSSNGNDSNCTFQKLNSFFFSSCSVSQFPNFLRKCKNLEALALSNNKIQGTISKWELEGWEELSSLDLSNNSLTRLDQFPGEKLGIINLQSNQLQGSLPVPPPSLRRFFISNNRLVGKIPPLICNLSSLEVLDLSANNLDGNIPPCLGNFSRFLRELNLQMNHFHGKIPNSFVKNNVLRTLALNDNNLEGLLPQSLINCDYLKFLNLANNKFRETFPHWLGLLPELYVLSLRFNRFHGPLDNSAITSYFFKLQILDLSHNEFSGPLPAEIFKNLRTMKDRSAECCDPHRYVIIGSRTVTDVPFTMNVTIKRLETHLVETEFLSITVDFSSNLFNGQIPREIGELRSLQVLNLSHNSLTGPIPPLLGNLVALESLDLSSNKLSGGIPSQLTSLTFLEVLNLSQNNLAGPIPNGKQFNTFEKDSYMGNPGLCGLPLTKKCVPELPPSSFPPPSSFVDPDDGIPFVWKVAMMGYGCGVVLGLSMGYIVFTTGRPWWFVRKVERDWQKNVSAWIKRNRPRRNWLYTQHTLKRHWNLELNSREA